MSPTAEVGSIQLFRAAPGLPLQWRLLGGNNRELGRSAQDYLDIERARTSVRCVQERIDELDGSVRGLRRDQWMWQLVDGDVVVAVCGRDYTREAHCVEGMHVFRRCLRAATITATVLVSNARRWEPRHAEVLDAPAAQV